MPEGADATLASGSAPVPLASALAGGPTAFVRADVALDGEPIVGSFTVDGMTFAVMEGSDVELVGVASDWQQVASSQEGDGSPAAPMLASGPDKLDAGNSVLALPESVCFEGIDYMVSSIAPYAFYLSGVASVELPASVGNVDERAFRSSDVASVEVDPGNSSFASYDGILYDAALFRLLLIPGGRTGAARISSKAEEVGAQAFSHCAGVTSISVDAGSDSYSSWDGLLYDASGATLLRVPAGATDITIRDGCTAIAAGALEGCAQLASITAPASVTSISPDVFTSVPTVSLPAASVVADDPGASTGATEEPSEQAGSIPVSGSVSTQLTALVALSSTADDLPEVDPANVAVVLAEGASIAPWEAVGFSLAEIGPGASLQDGSSYRAFELQLSPNGGKMTSTQYPGQTFTTGQTYSSGDSITFNSNGVIYYSGITITYSNPGCTFNCYSLANSYAGSSTRWTSGTRTMTTNAYLIWNVPITWNANGGYWNDDPTDTANKRNTWTSRTAAKGYGGSMLPQRLGYRFTGWRNSSTGAVVASGSNVPVLTATTYVAQWASDYTIHFDGNVVDDDAHPATVPADTTAARDTPMELPAPTRFGYIFKGWATHPYGSTANGNQVFAPGEKVVNLTDTPGDTVTLYALWALKYDADVPICAPADMTFALDATGTGEVRAVPADYAGDFSPSDMEAMGSTHSAAIESRMAVPVEVESVSAAAAEGDGFAKVLSSTDGSAPEDQLSFTVASGDAKASVKAGQSQALSGLLVPEASDATPVAKLALDYGLSLADTAVVLASDEAAAVPVAKVSYTLDVIDGMASKWGFFMLDGGTPVTPTRIKAAANDLAEADYAGSISASGYYEAFKDALDAASLFYLRVDDQPDGWFSVHEMNVLGICQDTLTTPRADASGATIATKAGLTFGFKDFYAHGTNGSNGTFDCRMNPTASNAGGWASSAMRARLRTTFMGYLDESVQAMIAPLEKYHQICGGTTAAFLQKTSNETVWLPSQYEVYGAAFVNYNPSESYSVSGLSPFQYQAYQGNNGSVHNEKAIKYWEGNRRGWEHRSAWAQGATYYCGTSSRATGEALTGLANEPNGISPCFAL